MIMIDRGPRPGHLKAYKRVKTPEGKLRSPADLERLAAIAFSEDKHNYANEKRLAKKSFDFKVYQDKELRAALDEVFRTKCAYCESRFAHVTPKDIEHFRPKSEIATDDGRLRPGYYWLAGEWNNLLVSCPDCNRAREHFVPELDKPLRLGKGMIFPLQPGAIRVRRPRRPLTGEELNRLLIDPCREDPAEHLTFDDRGWVLPRTDRRGKPSAKGVASIAGYALQRKFLVDERFRTLNDLIKKVGLLEGAILDFHNYENDGNKQEVERKFQEIDVLLDDLRSMLSEDAPYLAMKREWIARQKKAGGLELLERHRIRLERLGR